MGGRLRDAGEDLYDIRRGSAAFGWFVGAGRRLREVSGPAGLELPRLSWPSWARWARIFGEFSRSLARWARIFGEFSRSLARWARIFGEISRISSSFGGAWRSHVWSKMIFQRKK